MSHSFPEPDPAALAVSDALVGRLRAAISAAGGWIAFETFMQIALYEPGLGYYNNGSIKLGAGGDFTTGPELGDWLARSIAAFIDEIDMGDGPRHVLELGAGSGRLAEELLMALDATDRSQVDYTILEPSGELRSRQEQRLDAWRGRVRWLDRLPEPPITGIVLANEVADALPVARFEKRGGRVLPQGVALHRGRLVLETGPEDRQLTAAVAAIESDLGIELPEGYRSEVCLMLAPWLRSLCSSVEHGGVLLIDYGLPRRDYYSADRTDGTLICHYRHRAHADPLRWPGLQDITAWVDFSAVANAAQEAGFELSGYTTQAHFLLETLACNPGWAEGASSPAAISALKTLTLPGEMGERFKVIWLTRGIEASMLPGRDFRNWL